MNITEGAIPVSIGTSMAFETLVKTDRPNPTDPNRVAPKMPVPIDTYNCIYINISTMVRNLLGATDNPYSGSDSDMAEVIDGELGIIDELLPDALSIKLIVTDYRDIKRRLPEHVRGYNTDKQKKAHKRITAIVDELIKYYSGSDQEVTIWGLNRIKVVRDNALILTHEPVNLIHKNQFKSLHLLESHTGHIKTENKFYTKYYPMKGYEMERLPFLPELLVIFGDKVMFKPTIASYRKSILAIASTRKWTSMTTGQKIKGNMKLLDNTSIPNIYNEVHKNIPNIIL